MKGSRSPMPAEQFTCQPLRSYSLSYKRSMSTRPKMSRPMRVTKQMLGNQTRKSILYLDQNFLSSVQRGGIENECATALMAKVTRVLDLQLLAIPYSSTHIDESDLNGPYRNALVKFIQGVSRGHQCEPYYRVEETQILKAFQRFLDGDPAAYQKEERDALCPSVRDWDGDYRSEEHTSELQSLRHLVCRLL